MNSTNIVNGNINKIFFKYVSLSLLSMMGLSFYVLADTYFVANGVGNKGLTALNLVLPIYSLISGIGLMLGMGGATRFSILIGSGKDSQGNQVFTQVLKISVFMGLFITLIGVFFSDNISKTLGADSSILPFATVYLKTIMCFSMAFILNNVIVCFVRNDGNPKLSMIAMITGSVSNVILDYIFIFPLKMGMFGAAFATGLSPIISLYVLSFHFIKKKNKVKVEPTKLLKKEIKDIISIGIPSFITEFSSGIIMIVFNFAILKIAGNVGVAAYGIITNLSLIAIAIFTGIAQGAQPIISINYGSESMGNVREVISFAYITALISGILFFTFGILFSETIVGLFNRDGDVLLKQIALKGIKIYFIAFFIMGINIVTTIFFSSISKPRYSLIISTLRGFILILPLMLILPKFFGLTGVWITIPLAELITVAISTLCFRTK